MSDKPSDIIITIQISPLANGKRKIVVSGAPEKEMPAVYAGTFQDLHQLIDTTWRELMTRKPQVVKVSEPKSEKPASKPKKGDDQLDDDEQDPAPDPAQTDIDAQTPPIAEEPEDTTDEAEQHAQDLIDKSNDKAEDELPVIEGDDEESEDDDE